MGAIGAALSLEATAVVQEGSRVMSFASGLVARCHAIRYDTDLSPLVEGLHGNPFQSLPILSNWFATFAGRGDARECFLASLTLDDGTPVFALPLIRRRQSGLTRLELPFSGVIDFTTPFMRPDAAGLPAPEALWERLRPALPAADLAVFRRMTGGTSTLANPLFAHPAAQPSRFATWQVGPLAPREERHAALSKPCRKKLRRNREKFLALPGARFVVAQDSAQAAPLIDKLDALQGQRIREKGLDYALDCPRVKTFYRRLLVEGIAQGTTLLVGMMLGEEIIAVGYALLSREEAVYVRVASDFGQHAALTPGLLISDAAMDEAFARGIRFFDFGMGDYRFKRELGGTPNPLRDLILPLSLAGAPMATALRIYQRCALNPVLRGLAGRKPLPANPA